MDGFAERLRLLRTERGLTQTRLAELLGMPARSYNRWEHANSSLSSRDRKAHNPAAFDRVTHSPVELARIGSLQLRRNACTFPRADRMNVFLRLSAGRLRVLVDFVALGLEPTSHHEATSTPLVLLMVDAGRGAALVPSAPSEACHVASTSDYRTGRTDPSGHRIVRN
jgi:hypothetical protein